MNFFQTFPFEPPNPEDNRESIKIIKKANFFPMNLDLKAHPLSGFSRSISTLRTWKYIISMLVAI